MNGVWEFRFDDAKVGEKEKWYEDSFDMQQPRGKQRWQKDSYQCWYV